MPPSSLPLVHLKGIMPMKGFFLKGVGLISLINSFTINLISIVHMNSCAEMPDPAVFWWMKMREKV